MMIATLASLGATLQPFFAYLDPGTGSLILQGALAAIATVALMGRIFWHRILVFLKLRPAPQPSQEGEALSSASSEASEEETEPTS